MKKLDIYFLLFVVTLFGACKKNALPKDEAESNPEFYFKCNVNETPVNIQAGVNNYYMYSSHTQDNANVYVYKGEFRQKDCSVGCGYGISIEINDSKVSSPGAPMFPDSSLYSGPYQFNDGTLEPLYYLSSFYPTSQSTSLTGVYCQWLFSDNTPSTSVSQISKLFRTNTTQSITLNFRDTINGGFASHTNVFKIGNYLQGNVFAVRDQPLYPVKYTFGYNITSGNAIGNSYSYLWDFGDGSTSNLTNPSHVFLTTNSYKRVKLTLIATTSLSTSYTCTSYYQAPCFSYSVCDANFNAGFTPIQNIHGLSAITIKVTDPSGNVYSSSSINQSTNSNFEIISVEEFKTNEKGERTKKVKIKFNCSVVSGSNTLNISNGEAVIAVSYK